MSKGFFKINASSSTYLFSFQYVSKTYNVFINIHSDRDWNQELELFFKILTFSYVMKYPVTILPLYFVPYFHAESQYQEVIKYGLLLDFPK